MLLEVDKSSIRDKEVTEKRILLEQYRQRNLEVKNRLKVFDEKVALQNREIATKK